MGVRKSGSSGRFAALLLFLALPLLLPATPLFARQLPVEVEAGASREVLTGESDWEDYWIRATVRPAPGSHVWGGVRQTRRFGVNDQQFEGGAGLPLAETWSLGVNGTWSPTHRVLPRWGAAGELRWRLAPGWGVFFGGGRQRWVTTGVNRQHAGVERFFGPARLAYRLGFHQVDDGGSGVRHDLSGSWSYGTGSVVALGLGVGRDAVLAGEQDVRSLSAASASLSGVHWLDGRTGVTYNLVVFRHGDLFTRTGASVGVRRRL
jgi:YaiO family outer membrane protein